MKTPPRPINRLLRTALPALVALLAAACSRLPPTPDTSYLTPIPQATLDAYEYGRPVASRIQAVMFARKYALNFHWQWLDEPRVIFAEKMQYQEAKQRTDPDYNKYPDDVPGETPVWLVVFEGDYTITGPGGATLSPSTGCGYAIIFAESGESKAEGGGACERFNLDE